MQESTQTAKITREALFPFVHYEYGEASLRAVAWRGPMGYSAADESQKMIRDFPFSEEGLQEAAQWLNQCLEEAI